MKIHDGNITNIDRIALSNALLEVAEGFIQEQELWTMSAPARADFAKNARLLAEIGRGVLSGAADFTKAEAFHEAGRMQLGRAIASRRFFTAQHTISKAEIARAARASKEQNNA
jgi:hypothetical protein